MKTVSCCCTAFSFQQYLLYCIQYSVQYFQKILYVYIYCIVHTHCTYVREAAAQLAPVAPTPNDAARPATRAATGRQTIAGDDASASLVEETSPPPLREPSQTARIHIIDPDGPNRDRSASRSRFGGGASDLNPVVQRLDRLRAMLDALMGLKHEELRDNTVVLKQSMNAVKKHLKSEGDIAETRHNTLCEDVTNMVRHLEAMFDEASVKEDVKELKEDVKELEEKLADFKHAVLEAVESAAQRPQPPSVLAEIPSANDASASGSSAADASASAAADASASAAASGVGKASEELILKAVEEMRQQMMAEGAMVRGSLGMLEAGIKLLEERYNTLFKRLETMEVVVVAEQNDL